MVKEKYMQDFTWFAAFLNKLYILLLFNGFHRFPYNS